MKLKFLLACLFIHICCFSQVVLNGRILDSLKNRIVLFEPINGFNNTIVANPEWEIKPDSNGFFKHKVNLVAPDALTLFIGLRPVWLFAEPNDTITLDIDVNRFTSASPNGGIKMGGKNGKGNEYFNEFNYQPGWKFDDFAAITDSLNYRKDRDWRKLDYAMKRMVQPFDTLLARKQITQAFYDVMVPNIKGVLVTTELRYLVVAQKRFTHQQAVAAALDIYKQFPVTQKMIKQGLFNESIAYYYYKIKAAQHYSSMDMKDSLVFKNGKLQVVNSNLVYWLYAPKEVQEVHWPMSLLRLKKIFADSYDERDAAAVLAFNPESPMKPYLKPPYYGAVQTAKGTIDSSQIKRITDEASRSLDELLQTHFKGQRLYIDFWASWCVPCRQEFELNPQVDSFCRENNITKLYLSFDQPEIKKTMEKAIYAYNLKGYHVMVNETLLKDITNRFYGGKQEYAIPRYLIVNEKGEVVNADAPRPSSGNALFYTLNKDLNIKN